MKKICWLPPEKSTTSPLKKILPTPMATFLLGLYCRHASASTTHRFTAYALLIHPASRTAVLK